MTYVKTYLPTLKTHIVNLKRDAKDLSRDLQRLEVRGKLGSKTLYYSLSNVWIDRPLMPSSDVTTHSYKKSNIFKWQTKKYFLEISA